jgi:hypothetical protein
MPSCNLSKTSISEHLVYERVPQSSRSCFAVNESIHSKHLPTLNSKRFFWSQNLYLVKTRATNYARVYETREKNGTMKMNSPQQVDRSHVK